MLSCTYHMGKTNTECIDTENRLGGPDLGEGRRLKMDKDTVFVCYNMTAMVCSVQHGD